MDDNAYEGLLEDPQEEAQDDAPAKNYTNSLYNEVKKNPIRTVHKMVSASEIMLQERSMVWERYRKKYRRALYYLKGNAFLSEGAVPYFTNYLFSNVETMKAALTKTLPMITASPKGQKDDIAADILTGVLKDVLVKGGIQHALRGLVHNGLIATMGWIKTYFDPLTRTARYDSVLPENMLVDPLASCEDQCRWFIQKRPNVSYDEIYANFGKEPVPTPAKEGDGENNLNNYNDAKTTETGLYTSTTAGEAVGNSIDVYEAWIRVWDEDRENDWYVVTIAGQTVLKAEFSVYSHNETPFTLWLCGEDDAADNLYYKGIGVIEEIEPLQDKSDSMDRKIMKHLTLMANRQRYVSTNSGLNPSIIDNTEGRVYAVQGDPQKAVYYDIPPSLSQEVYSYRDNIEPAIQTVSGVFDVMQGRRPKGITAGRAISELKDSAETRMSNMSDTIGTSVLQSVGRKTLQIILQLYDDDVLIKSSDADKDQAFVVLADYPEELQPMGATPMAGEDGQFQVDEEGNYVMEPASPDEEIDPELVAQREAWKAENQIALVLSDIDYDWDIRVDTDNALPNAKAERGQIAADYFRLGAIDREALLDTVEFPNKKKILQRLQAEVTGKSAGDPNAEAGTDVIAQMMMQLEQVLTQSGAPPEIIQQIMGAMQPQENAAPEGGSFQPQIVM